MGADKKNTSRTKKAAPVSEKRRNLPGVLLFWMLFFIVVIGIFVSQYDTIRENLRRNNVRLPFFNTEEGEAAGQVVQEIVPEEIEAEKSPEEEPVKRPAVAVGVSTEDTPAVRQPGQNAGENDKLKNEKPKEIPAERKSVPAQSTQAQKVPVQKEPAQSSPARSAPEPKKPAAALRSRTLYFVRVDEEGLVLRSPVSRQLPVSDSPLMDALKELLAGPSAAEKRQGMMTLIPSGTRILSATVRGRTVHISFNEGFLYNTYGVEGYAAQLRQIVWTATEFSNVDDVQILIEGRRVDYLGEGIWIGGPVSRQNF